MDLFSTSISSTAVQNITPVWHICNNIYFYTRMKCLHFHALAKSSFFWGVKPCCLVPVHRKFWEACCLHHQGIKFFWSVISDFAAKVDENCALLGYYAARSGNILPTFRDNLSVPSTVFKKFSYYAAGSGNLLQTFRDSLPVPSSGSKPRVWYQRVVPKRR